jgi:UDP:flavonoid glycosyltransferase YjiC (YdhE family)
VNDILTRAPALAAELRGVRWATLIPHVYPVHAAGLPFYGFGALRPRTVAGRALWRTALPILEAGLRRGREELNRTRTALGLPPTRAYHSGISTELALVATLPQLEYPRRWPSHVQVIGPLVYEIPHPDVELPPGDAPLVVVAPSTAKDHEGRLIRASLAALRAEPVRVLASTNRSVPAAAIDVPANARLVDWVSYSQVMPMAALVICHGGHGTVARALASGCVVVAVPAAGDMNENAARIDWAGVGVRVPRRLCTPGAIRLAVERALATPSRRERARTLAAWTADHNAATHAAGLIEALAVRYTN